MNILIKIKKYCSKSFDKIKLKYKNKYKMILFPNIILLCDRFINTY